MAKRRFRYSIKEGFIISNDADFVICGEIFPNDVKPEGPFGDHLGYYSVIHDFPVLKVAKVYAKKEAVWPFTVVGRPPQEDSFFGKLIHEITKMVKKISLEINAIGLINVQLAYYQNELYLLEVNPRASRTIPFVSKCIGKSWQKLVHYVWLE